MASEKAPLLPSRQNTGGSDSFRPISQGRRTWLGGWRPCGAGKKEGEGTFSSSLTVVISMLGCAVGTGNIWRFPRIVANNATEGGALSFLIIWFCFLWLWSVPIILIEYGVGRFTKKGNIESFAKLLGPAYRFMGAFPALVSFCSTSYYSVLVGWCGYYFIMSCAHSNPDTLAASTANWDYLQGSYWPVLCHGLAIIAASLSVSRGVSTIEPVNNIIIPILLVIVIFCFYWALYLPYATLGLQHMFSPSWSSFSDSNLWLDALSQNAWDTGAGLGSFLTFATYMKREQGAVKLGAITPFLNNVVSMLCGIMVFCTVFSVQSQQGLTTEMIVKRLGDNGPANTGITFIWMPILFHDIDIGRFISIIFFFCLTLAGLSSLIALMELSIHCFTDYGVRRLPATILIACGMFGLGTASAVDLNILVNQDYVWAFAMILSGCLLLFLVFRYGVLRFRRDLYLDFGIGDWPLPWVWVIIVTFIAPIEGIGVIMWWIVDEMVSNPDTWWTITTTSLATTLAEWAFLMILALGLNWFMKPLAITRPKSAFWQIVLASFVRFKVKEEQLQIYRSEETSVAESLALSNTDIHKEFEKEKESIVVRDIEL